METVTPIHTYDDHPHRHVFSLAAFNPAKLPIRIVIPNAWAKLFLIILSAGTVAWAYSLNSGDLY
jgi:hypothetical protein